MRGFITFLAVIAVAKAAVLYSPNDLGPLQYGGGSITRQEIRTPDGIIHGTYTYIGEDGQSQTISYGDEKIVEAPVPAEGNGERPQSVQQTQEANGEVVESEGQDVKKDEPTEGGSPLPELPQPVPYTPEVAAARAAHFAARDQAIYLQQLTNSQQLLDQPIVEYPPFFRDYYGAARHFRTQNPFYFL